MADWLKNNPILAFFVQMFIVLGACFVSGHLYIDSHINAQVDHRINHRVSKMQDTLIYHINDIKTHIKTIKHGGEEQQGVDVHID